MDKLVAQFKEYWADKEKRNNILILLVLAFLFIEDEPVLLILKYAAIGFVAVLFDLLSEKYLKLHKKGPMPWYSTPILWVGVPALIFMVYVFSW
ncbi:hypothetical protein [Brumicola blandensis]|uniref:Uncharacterized protein n=1 Tax=Brumicola blandensis TaxID=3075611 RepID=A0AAW8R521_9ALTE|nr:hypothetical protein [Alteromonas sp. W409]MDT0584352.1 hypothetical protein [Alteromonas sp. W409]